MPDVLDVFVLAIVQGVCELLPVSSSAHVIIAEKLMGLDPTTPAMTFLLVMLHTGTMLAVIVYFWNTWRSRFFSSAAAFWSFARNVVAATACTGIVGLGLTLVEEEPRPVQAEQDVLRHRLARDQGEVLVDHPETGRNGFAR
jgi:undecaprenyl-diphosphatase